MHPKNHANLIRFRNTVYHPITMFALFIIFAIVSISIGFFYIMFVWVVYAFLRNTLNDILWRLPVHCDKPGCDSAIEKTYTQQPKNKAQLQYKCPSCGSVYETTIHSIRLEPDVDRYPW